MRLCENKKNEKYFEWQSPVMAKGEVVLRQESYKFFFTYKVSFVRIILLLKVIYCVRSDEIT